MSDERMRILSMLEEGMISAEEAAALLESGGSQEEPAAPPEPVELPDSPDMDHLRTFWRIPFYISIGVLLLVGIWIGSVFAANEGRLTFGLVCLWSVFLMAAVATAITLWSRTSPWVHVRVQERDGTRIAISLPFPIILGKIGLNAARPFVPDKERAQLEMAAAFLDEVHVQTGNAPLVVDVDDEGDKVQVYIG